MKNLSNNPFVSVIVNTVDRPEDLKRCIEAVYRQTYRNFEIVIVNNGKGEETKRYLRELNVRAMVSQDQNFPQVKVIDDQTKKLSYLFNVGWKNASTKAEIFAYCADDTEPDSDWLKHIVEYLRNNSACGAVSGPTLATTTPPGEMFALYDLIRKTLFGRVFLRLYEYFVMEDKTMSPGHWPESGAFTMGAGIPQPKITEPLEIDLLTSGNMGITRESMESVQGFDEHFLFNHADGDLFIRLKRQGWKLVFHPKVSVLHHMRFGPTRFPEIMGRDTAFYYLKDVRPKSLRGWVGFFFNLGVFLSYWVYKAFSIPDFRQFKGISGFITGIVDFFRSGTKERNEILKTLLVVFMYSILFGFAFRNLDTDFLLAYGDAVPFPKTYSQAFSAFFSSWDIRSPGLYMPQIPVLSSLTFLEGVLIFIFGENPARAQAVFHWLPLPLAFISIYWFLGKLGLSRSAKFLAGFIYSANLVAVGEVLGGFEGSLYVQALFPILLYLLYAFYNSKSFEPKIVVSFSLVLSFAYLLSDHVLIFLIPFAVIFTVGMFLKRRFYSWMLFWTVAVFLVILLTLFHTYYYFSVAFPFLSGGLRSEVVKSLTNDVIDTYNHVGLLTAFTVGGRYFANIFGTSKVWEYTGILLPLISFSWVLFPANRQKKKLIVGAIFTVGALLTVYMLTNTRLNHVYDFQKLPFLFRFRNPSRFWLFLTFCYGILSGLTVDAFISYFNTMNNRFNLFLKVFSWFIISIVFFSYGSYFHPFFSGDFTLSKNRSAGYVISKKYLDIGSWVAIQHLEQPFFRDLWIPWNHEESEVKLYWLDPYAYAVPINYGSYIQNDYLKGLVKNYENLANEKEPLIAKSLASAGIKYIFLNTDSMAVGRAVFEYAYHTPWLNGLPGDWRRILRGTAGIKYLRDISGYEVYLNTEYSPNLVDRVLSGDLPEDNLQHDPLRKNLILVSFSALVLCAFFLKFFPENKKS